MAINDKIRAMLSLEGKSPKDLTDCLGISSQAIRNKLSRNTFSIEDLIKTSDYLGYQITISKDDSKIIKFDMTDLKTEEE